MLIVLIIVRGPHGQQFVLTGVALSAIPLMHDYEYWRPPPPIEFLHRCNSSCLTFLSVYPKSVTMQRSGIIELQRQNECGLSTIAAGGGACSPLTRPLLLNDDNGILTSPFYPHNYMNLADCQWVITVIQENSVTALCELQTTQFLRAASVFICVFHLFVLSFLLPDIRLPIVTHKKRFIYTDYRVTSLGSRWWNALRNTATDGSVFIGSTVAPILSCMGLIYNVSSANLGFCPATVSTFHRGKKLRMNMTSSVKVSFVHVCMSTGGNIDFYRFLHWIEFRLRHDLRRWQRQFLWNCPHHRLQCRSCNLRKLAV